jgi:hypothetical protein
MTCHKHPNPKHDTQHYENDGLTPWCRVFLEKLIIDLQLVMKFLTFMKPKFTTMC